MYAETLFSVAFTIFLMNWLHGYISHAECLTRFIVSFL